MREIIEYKLQNIMLIILALLTGVSAGLLSLDRYHLAEKPFVGSRGLLTGIFVTAFSGLLLFIFHALQKARRPDKSRSVIFLCYCLIGVAICCIPILLVENWEMDIILVMLGQGVVLGAALFFQHSAGSMAQRIFRGRQIMGRLLGVLLEVTFVYGTYVVYLLVLLELHFFGNTEAEAWGIAFLAIVGVAYSLVAGTLNSLASGQGKAL